MNFYETLCVAMRNTTATAVLMRGPTNVTCNTSATGYVLLKSNYEGWNFNSGNYLFTIDTK